MTVKKFKGKVGWKIYRKLQKTKNGLHEPPKKWQIKSDNILLEGDKIDLIFSFCIGMLCSNSFSPYFHPIFSPLLEKGIQK